METLESRQLLSITLPTISNVTLPAGTSVFVPLAGTDPGETLSYAVTVSDYSKLTPVMMPDTNETIRFTVNIDGVDQTMDFRLFDNFVPVATSYFEDLVQSGTYNTSTTNTPIIYRNLKDGSNNPLCIQGGNPNLTDATTIDEEFNPNLQYTSGGILAMARQDTPGTSSTEFFITEQAYRAWDYNYTIFGTQIAGSNVVSTIAGKPNQSSTSQYLQDPIVITSASIVADSQTGVLELRAPEGVTGTYTVTVTAYDGTNTAVTREFTVTIGADSGTPANPWESVTPSAPTSVTFLPPTGTSTVVTNLDNSDINNSLDFQVTGVTSGNLVQILADGNVIGEEYATSSTVVVTTDGWTTLTTGVHQFTAIQIAEDQTVDVIESGDPDPISKTANVSSLNSAAVQLTVDLTTPVADLTVANITTNSGATQTFTVDYTDDIAVDVSTLDSADIRVAGPNGYNVLATYLGVDINSNGASRTATYQIPTPGVTWDETDNGTYTVSMEAGQVRNTTGNSVDSGSLGAFTVNVPSTIPQATATATGITTGATTTHTFTVTYTDDFAIDVSTLDNSDVRVTSPNGYNQLATFKSVSVNSNGTPRTATYEIPAPGATWDEADNGTYTISIEAGQVTDTSGNAVVAGTRTTFVVNVPPAIPQASLPTVAAVTTGGGTTKTFTVTYTDDVGVKVSTLDSFDVRVTNTNGYNQLATFKSVSVNNDGTPRTATYEITAPGGVWDKADNGTYKISIEAGQVTDNDGNAVAASELGTFAVNIVPVLGLTIDKTSILETGTATGTITLTEPAPAGGLTVYLSSSDTGEATVPANIVIPAGSTTGTFAITGVKDGLIDGSQSVTISATAADYNKGTASLSVNDATGTVTVTIDQSSISENGAATGTVTLSQPAPAGGVTIYLSSSDATEAVVPLSIFIAEGATSGTFTVAGMQDGTIDGTQTVTITASPASVDFAKGTASLTVLDATKSLSVSIDKSTILETGTATGTVTLSSPAPAGGLVVSLGNSDASEATFPATIFIAAGATTGTFTITGKPDGIIDGAQSVTITATASDYVAGTTIFAVFDATQTVTVTVDKSSIAEGGTATGTITLSQAAPAGGLVVYLSSSDTGEATVPASVTIAAGQTTATFAISGKQDNTIDGSQSVTITATPASLGYAVGTASLNVTDATNTISVSIDMTSILETGSATGLVTLSQAAPEGGLLVTLSSSDTGEATVPATIFIEAGKTFKTFTVTGVKDGAIDGSQSVTITATGADYTSGTASLSVRDATQTVSVTIDKSSISEAGTAIGTITLSQAAPAGGLVITLSSSSTTDATVPASVTIPEGSTTATFTITGVQDSTIDGVQTVTITATPASLDYAAGTASLSVVDAVNAISLTIDKTSILETGTATGTITLSQAAPEGGLYVTLSSSDTGEATVPETVFIAAGQTTTTFTITGVKDGILDGLQTVTITAEASDYTSTTANLGVNDATQALTVTIDASSITEAGTATGTITLSQAAPAGGLLVYLSSSSTTDATVPASVTIAAGQTTATFTITGVQDTTVDGTKSVTITATPASQDYAIGTANLSVIDATKTISVTIDKSSILETGSATGTITLSHAAPAGGLVVYLTSNDTTEATVLATVTIAAGQTTATFTITGVQDGSIDGSQSVTITASAGDYVAGSANLTVNDATKTITVTIDKTSILETGTATGTVTLSQAAPTGGLIVYLTSNDTTEATVLATVTIAAGQTTGTFTITGVQDGTVDGTQSVTITASAGDYVEGTASLNVNDATKTLTVTIDKSSIMETGSATGTITLSQPAPTGGLVVYLSSSSTADATVPASVTIAAGSTTATFTITGMQDGTVDGTQSVTITATAPDYASGTAGLNVFDATKGITVTVDKTGFFENGSAIGTITLSQAAPAGGLVVTLRSSDITAVSIPTTVTVPGGATSTTFAIAGLDNTVYTGDKTAVTITAIASDYVSGTSPSLTVYDDEQNLAPTLSVADVSSTEDGGSFTFTITLSLPTTSAVTVQYATSDGTATAGSDYKAKSGTATIAAGQTSVKVTIPVYGDRSAELNETFNVTLSNSSTNAIIGDGIAVGTILNDDGAVEIPAADVTGGSKIGLFSEGSSVFFLKNSNSTGYADTTFAYGPANAGWQVISGDWDGDGTDTIGLYDRSAGTFYLRNSNTTGYATLTFHVGSVSSSLTAIAGDWNGDGTDTVGLYDSSTGTFHMASSNGAGASLTTFVYGMPGWKPIVGDWDGNGTDTVGLYEGTQSVFFLKNSNTTGYADVTFGYGPANAGWTPIAGDWNADGTDTIGLYDGSASTFYLRNSNTAGFANSTFAYGPANAGWTPIVGNWTGAQALMAADGATTGSSQAASLTKADVDSTVSAAIGRLAGALNLSTDAVAKLASTQFAITDLSGSQLGVTQGNTIHLDTNAAGHGWFVDSTPAADEEFVATSGSDALQAVDSRAVDKIDLLTVVEHELGHVLGLDDAYGVTDELMSATLGVGTRHDAYADSVDAVLARV
jgi:cyclophilin family peptidyl-prolyl cis-trans isomerase